MKDYSEFIKSEYGFIRKIEIIDDEILITTSKTKKGQPHKYELTKENVQKYFGRLEKQYQMVIDNQDKIKEEKSIFSKMGGIILILVMLTAVFGIMTVVVPTASSILSGVATVLGSLFAITSVGSLLADKLFQKKFEKAIETYKYFLEHRQELESAVMKDKNITSYINNKTQNIIQENEALVKTNKVEDIFNINLMDEISLKQLKELLLRFKISQSLEDEQHFEIPNKEKSSSKKRSLRKEKQ